MTYNERSEIYRRDKRKRLEQLATRRCANGAVVDVPQLLWSCRLIALKQFVSYINFSTHLVDIDFGSSCMFVVIENYSL